MRQYKNICTKENFEAEFQYLKLATLIYNKFLGWYDSYDQLCELQAEEGKYAIVGNTLTDAVVYEGTSSCWESTGVLFFQKFIDDFVSSEVTLTDEQKRTICVLIGASYGSEGGSGSGSGSGGTIDIEKYLKEVGKYLKAGNHISITNNTISCLLEPGDGIAINNNKISCTDTKVFEIVNELPISNIKDDKIYLLDEGNGKFSQYVYSGGGWNNITPKAETVIPTEGGDITKEQILQLLGFDRNNSTQYLRKDGQWATPPDTNTTYNNATQSEAGLMSALDKKKLDTLQNVTAASLLDYSSDTTTFLRHDGEWATPPNTSYNVATQSSDGLLSAADKTKLDSLTAFNKTSILSKLEAGNDTTKFLRNDGQWAVPPDNDTTYNPATSTTNGLMSAEDKRKLDSLVENSGNASGETTVFNYQTNPYNIPEDSKLLEISPYTYIKVQLQGTLYESNRPQGYLFAQLGSQPTILNLDCPNYLANAGDYYEELLPTKRTSLKNGKDVRSYGSGNAEYLSMGTLSNSLGGIVGKLSTISPYLHIGKYHKSGVDIGLPNNDIIQIDNNSPTTINNSIYTYQASHKESSGNSGNSVEVYCTHLRLPVLDGKPHIITYLGGAKLLQPSETFYKEYLLLNPNDSYENRLIVNSPNYYTGDGFVPSKTYEESGQFTLYYVEEYDATFNETLPKQILYRGGYSNLVREEYDGTLADGYGRLYGYGYKGIFIGFRRYGDYTKNFEMYSKISILNNETILTVNNSQSQSIYISPNKQSSLIGDISHYGSNYFTGDIKDSSGISSIKFKTIYKIEIRSAWLSDDDYDGMSFFDIHGNNQESDFILTPLKEQIQIVNKETTETP